ncbi:Hsp70 family protein, partial [bacterium]|nr:Hsp70 family protein [bacterium]
LGIETQGGVFTKMINRNTTIPTKKTDTYTTAADNQTEVEVHVLQGEREMASYNKSLGKFHLQGIPSAPRGVPKIEVTFDIDANGIVNVTAKDTATGKQQNITITGSSNLDNNEIDKMVEDAERYADEDKKRREEVDVRNNADSMVYQTEKMLKEHGDKLPEADKQAVESALAELKTALEGTDTSLVKERTEVLTQASYKLAEYMYKDAGGDAQAAGAEGAQGADDSNVVDAEFTEVSDNDNK